MAFCGNCGNELREGATYCSKCGTSVNDTQELQVTKGRKFSKPWITAFAVLTILIGSYFVIEIVSPETHNKIFSGISSGSSLSKEQAEDSQSGEAIYSGTYKLEGGYSLTINKDQTARLFTPNGDKFAASTTCWVIDYISIQIDWDIENPLKIKGQSVFVPVIGKEKDYLYFEVSAYNAKNENKRIKIISFSK